MPVANDITGDRLLALRDMAVESAMRHGVFEASGEAKLVVLRDGGLMIAYRTPFNPLPRLSESMKFEAALRGKAGHREPYGIDVWDRKGKVLSLGWRDGGVPIVDGYEPGSWERTLANISRHDVEGLCRKCAAALASRSKPMRGTQDGHSGNRHRTALPGRSGSDG